MKLIKKLSLFAVFSTMSIIMSATITNAQTKQLAERPRVAIALYDVLTMEFADRSYPKLTITTPPGKLFLVMEYSELIFAQSNLAMANECDRLECTAIEITLEEKADIKDIEIDILSAKHVTKPKLPQDRIAQIKIIIPDAKGRYNLTKKIPPAVIT